MQVQIFALKVPNLSLMDKIFVRNVQRLKLSPQLQVAFALGLENLKPPPIRSLE